MNYRYDNHFNASCNHLPVAYYRQRSRADKYLIKDTFGHLTFASPHNHAEFEIILFTKGSGKVTIGFTDKEFAFEEGDLILINPFEFHGGYYDADHPECSHQCLDFSVSVLEHPLTTMAKNLANSLLNQSIRCEHLFSHKEERYEELKQAFFDMYHAVSDDAEDDLLFFGGLFRFFSIVNSCGKIHTTPNSSVKDPNLDFIKQVLSYMEQHYTETIYTRDIAKELAYNKEHFCRLFKSHFATSFTTYLTQFRIEKAKSLLLQESSTKVAELCGFSSQSNFAKSFRDHVGITPAKYRKFLTGD